MTKPTSMEIKVAGAQIPGNSSSYNLTRLYANTTYYGWAMAVDGSGNESVIVASTPTFLQTLSSNPIPTTPSNFGTSLASMTHGLFGGSLVEATPYNGLQNLPSFLVGGPMTKAINTLVYACAFDRGPIHAYVLRASYWSAPRNNLEPGVELIYSGTKYDGNHPDVANQVVYKYFPNPTFDILTSSYIWFFTRTPRDIRVAALNAP